MSLPEVVCLLPVRNGSADLAEWFESALSFCDTVVALDDGSTDETRALLLEQEIVKVVLSNPPRPDFAGWNDGANRSRLLHAAGGLDPRWIVSMDVDERIDADEGAALRRFLDTDALPGLAYGFQHYRMWEEGTYDPHPTWVYRLFAYEPGHVFPERRLHFNPVPSSIPRGRWVRTTIRLRHLGASSEALRLMRLAKYREADPAGEYRTDFGGLASVPAGTLPTWPRRPDDLPVLAAPRRPRRATAPACARAG